MVETALDVAPGGQADGNVGRELPIAAPILVRAVDELLHRWPEVVSELCPLNDHTDLVAEAAHPVGRTDDVVLGDRGVEDTLVPELLQHPLGHIEDTALVLIRYVLPPDEGIGVVTELLLERLIDRLHQRQLFTCAVGDP